MGVTKGLFGLFFHLGALLWLKMMRVQLQDICVMRMELFWISFEELDF